MSLPAFPRGCREIRLPAKRPNDTKDEDLFKMAKKQRKYKRKNDADEEEGTEGQKEGSDFTYFGPLMPEMLSGGLLVLGCVDEIHDYDLTVSLPNGLSGIVSITDVSQPYTKTLQAHADDDSDASDTMPPPPLRDIFSVGRYVMCSVKKAEEETDGKAKRLTPLTVDPKIVNAGVMQGALYHGMLLCAAVVSEEDHGYAMDTGITGASVAFLRSDKAAKYQASLNHDRELAVGQVVWCAIDMPEHDFEHDRLGSLQLTADPTEVVNCRASEIKWGALLPGTLMAGAVQLTDPLGLGIGVLEQDAVVHHSHLVKPLEWTNDYRLQQGVEGRLLYINPISNVIHLGLQHRIRRLYNQSDQFAGISKWDIVEEATVVHVTIHSVTFSIKKKIKGYANKLNVPREFVDDLPSHFTVGSTHRCRVTHFRRIDGVVYVTLEPELLNKQMILFDALQVGDQVMTSVTRQHAHGLHVKVLNTTELVFGFVPDILISDSNDSQWKHDMMPGHQLACQVVNKKVDENFVFLASKKSILGKGAPILSSIDEAKPGMVVRGWVIRVNNDSLIISFNNGIKGQLKFSNIPSSEKDKLVEQYTCGQVVKCRVTIVDRQTGKLFLELSSAARSVVPAPAVVVPEQLAETSTKKRLKRRRSRKSSPSKSLERVSNSSFSHGEKTVDVTRETKGKRKEINADAKKENTENGSERLSPKSNGKGVSQGEQLRKKNLKTPIQKNGDKAIITGANSVLKQARKKGKHISV